MTPSESAKSTAPIPFDAIVEQSVAGIYIIQDEKFVYCNRKWANIVGYTMEEILGCHLSLLVPEENYAQVLGAYYARLTAEPASMHFISWGQHRLGHTIRIEVHGTRVMYLGRPAVMGIGIDVTDRLRNEAELLHSKTQLQALAAYTNEKLEEQRIGIARDIHDQLGGMLSSIKMDATRIMRRANTEELREITDGLLQLTQKTIEAIQEISQSLRPSGLDHLDLAIVVRRELEEFSQRFGISHSMQNSASTYRLSPRSKTTIYRIFHEALTNVGRHSLASHVDLNFRDENSHFVLEMVDNGVGFDSAGVSAASMGLLSMIERSREIKGLLQFISQPGSGTTVKLVVPLL